MRVMNAVHLGPDPDIALRITLVSNDANRRLVDQIHRGAEFTRHAERLAITPGVGIDQNGLGVFHVSPDCFQLSCCKPSI